MSDKQLKSNMPSVPIWKKMNLTVEEASEYSGIGTSKIKELSNSEDSCPQAPFHHTLLFEPKVILSGVSGKFLSDHSGISSG